MSKALSTQCSAARNASRILLLVKGKPAGLTSGVIADKLHLTVRTVVSLCLGMQAKGELMSRPGAVRVEGQYPMVWFTPPTEAPLAAEARYPFRAYTPPRMNVIPVRAGGRIARDLSDDPRIGMGHWSHNPFSPMEVPLQ